MTDLFFAASPLLAIAVTLVVIIFTVEFIANLCHASLLGLYTKTRPNNLPPFIQYKKSGLVGLRLFGMGKLPFLLWLATFLSLFVLVTLLTAAIGIVADIPATSTLVLGIINMLITGWLCGHCAAWLAWLLFGKPRPGKRDTLSGCQAEITMGVGCHTHPTEARLINRMSTPHYILVVPADKSVMLQAGEIVTLVNHEHGYWTAQRV